VRTRWVRGAVAAIFLAALLANCRHVERVPVSEMSQDEYYARLKECVPTIMKKEKAWQESDVAIGSDLKYSILLRGNSSALSLKQPGTRERLILSVNITRSVLNAAQLQADIVPVDARQVKWPDNDDVDLADNLYKPFSMEQDSQLQTYVLTVSSRISNCLRRSKSTAFLNVARPGGIQH